MTDAAVPSARRCYLHIGLQKTGTSYLQKVFWQSRPALQRQGLAMVPDSKLDTFRLMQAVRERLREDVDPPVAFEALPRLRALVETGTAPRLLVTEESLAPATAEQAQRLVDHLPGVEVHVVLTVRDLARQIPSVWQQKVSARRSYSFAEYLHQVETRGPRSRSFWDNQDVPEVLARWGKAVPPERIHVVTVPPSGSPPAELLARFCSVLEIDPATLDTEVDRSNASLGLVQTELLRRVNHALGDRLPTRNDYRGSGKFYFAKQVLADQRGRRALVPTRLQAWCVDTAARHVAAIREGEYDVVGSLDDLVPLPGSFTDRSQEVSEREVADVAAAAIATMLVDHHEGQRALRRLTRRLERAGRPDVPPARPSLPRRVLRRVRRRPVRG